MKVISLNVERHKHFEKVKMFLERENPEVICLMEVCESDVSILAGVNYPYVSYAPNDLLNRFKEGIGTTGVAILAKKPIQDIDIYYFGEDFEEYSKKPNFSSHCPVIITGKIGETNLAAIHFSWTEGGSIDERQRKHMELLLGYLSNKGELVMCGDFNIPRGNEMYQKLAEKYLDNLPAEVTTTIDPRLHRANFEEPGKIKFVVDYVWSTPKYKISEVKVVEGVSDHYGIVFELA